VAVRDNERAAAAFGLTPATVKLSALALSGFLAGVAGVIWADAWRTADPGQFDPVLSIALLAVPVVGGLGSVSGAVAGAALIYMPTFFLSDWFSGLFGNFGHQLGFQLFLSGLALVVVLRSYPLGLAGMAAKLWQRFLDRLASEATAAREASDERPLVVEGVALSFGGVHALRGTSMEVRRNEIVGLIGANGAGKTTLMNVISGILTPDAGSVRVFGRDMAGLAPEYRMAFGVARSFQDARLFPGLTVTQTIQVAMSNHHRVGLLSSAVGAPWVRASERSSRRRALEIVEQFGLAAWADTPTADLSTGTRRVCDLAAQLAVRPRLLLLDEPTAGLAQREGEAFGPLLRRIRDELECSILLIEHDMPLLMGLCDRIYAMEGGQVFAEGTPAQIRSNPDVIASYLGTDPAAIDRSGRKVGSVAQARKVNRAVRANAAVKANGTVKKRVSAQAPRDAARG
jgi:ABC-type branched-subunit amino acid transport system ATPase component